MKPHAERRILRYKIVFLGQEPATRLLWPFRGRASAITWDKPWTSPSQTRKQRGLLVVNPVNPPSRLPGMGPLRREEQGSRARQFSTTSLKGCKAFLKLLLFSFQGLRVWLGVGYCFFFGRIRLYVNICIYAACHAQGHAEPNLDYPSMTRGGNTPARHKAT
jgi:hypothetical protein